MSLLAHCAGWKPEPLLVREVLGRDPADAFAALLDQPSPVDTAAGAIPPLWTILHFLERPATTELGADGHPSDGHFLPPIPHRRRMFAGGRLRLGSPVRVGDEITRRTSLASLTPKTGRSGSLLFLTVRHEYLRDGSAVQVEEQDIVYRSGGRPGPPPQRSDVERRQPWTVSLHPDPALLFRFSALTYNAHRIHYDRPYATDVEGFPGLVVHGPLLALLLLELPRRYAPDQQVRDFAYRLRAPAFCGTTLVAAGGPGAAALACGAQGSAPSITGTVTLG